MRMQIPCACKRCPDGATECPLGLTATLRREQEQRVKVLREMYCGAVGAWRTRE